MEKETEYVELTSEWAVFEIPENAVTVEMRIGVMQDGELIHVGLKLSPQEVRKAFQRAEDGYIDDDAKFSLTDEGRRIAEQLFTDD